MENISQEDKTKITQLIKTNLTPLDISINMDPDNYIIKKKDKASPTIEAVNHAKIFFTEPFLKHINDIIKDFKVDGNKVRDTIAYIISGLFVPFNIPSTYRTEPFPTVDKPYPFAYYYSPVNRLYFLFLVNLYCNYQNYNRKYDWLGDYFLFLCDQIGLTGVFAIDVNLYNVLFQDCHENSSGVGTVEDGYFLLSNSSIRINLKEIPLDEQQKEREKMSKFTQKVFKFGKTQKSLAGKTQKLNLRLPPAVVAAAAASAVAASVAPASVAPATSATLKTKTPCIHGVNCFRTKNKTHREEYSHPMDITVGGAKRKRKTYKNNNTHKRKKTHKKRNTHKRKKHSKRK